MSVTIVRNREPRGPGCARNRALDHIGAPWLITLDSDDTLEPRGMLALLEALQASSAAEWAAGRCHHVDPIGRLLWQGPEDPFPPGAVPVGAFWEVKLKQGGLPFLCTATVASSEAIRGVGGWPEDGWRRAEDTALWAVLTSQHPGIWVAVHAYNYRRHTLSLTQQPGFRRLDERVTDIVKLIAAGNTNPHRKTKGG